MRIYICVLAPVTLHSNRDRRSAGGYPHDTGQTKDLPHCHARYSSGIMSDSMSLGEAVARTRTGDVWLFRGHSVADRAIQTVTNSPVNHVGMAVTLEDMPPLMWHAELGQSLVDVWSGEHRRGTQLHRLTEAVQAWSIRYGQRAWLRQIDIDATPQMEDAVLRTVNEYDGALFPSSVAMAKGWAQGRISKSASTEAMYCAEVVAVTYQRMGLLGTSRPVNWYDPGRFWSGDRLKLQGASLGPEIAVTHIEEFDATNGPQ